MNHETPKINSRTCMKATTVEKKHQTCEEENIILHATA